MWRDNNAALLTEQDGKALISVAVDGNTYVYAIDTSTWRIVGLEILTNGFTQYKASFLYYPGYDVPLLHKIAINELEDLSEGGYEFTNITINGSPPAPVRNGIRLSSDPGRSRTARKALLLSSGSHRVQARAFEPTGRIYRGPETHDRSAGPKIFILAPQR